MKADETHKKAVPPSRENPVAEEGHSTRFLTLVALFVTCLITANIMAVKLITLGTLILPAAIVIFPISYIVGDVLTEVYGYSKARQVIWLGFACNALAVLALWLGQIMPPAPFWKNQEAYEAILGAAPRILLASFLAYLVGEFSNAYVLARLKIATNGRWLWVRTIGSTLVGQGLDSLVFMVAAFAGTIPGSALVMAVVVQWLAKSCYEAAVTPVTYMVVNHLKRKEGVDFYDKDTRFNPLIVSR
jgi:uncharacterized integral membrane protein (TIGR00697 family)